jgi:DNA polymerase-3 subunit epsilon|tara:strand:- start:1511 stop:2233 length:723 start_codon:yes stop_codon:yes gene_type:complete
MTRQVVLDTETTGLEPSENHRIIEIGCVELIDRQLTGRHYHQYINPERDIDQGAVDVHGITTDFLADKPVFSSISKEFIEFITGAQLIIHNAPFDIGFIDHEMGKLKEKTASVVEVCSVIDTLVMARERHPGQRNNLNALCKRYFVDNSKRDLHGALLDAEILADVYLLMTGGQVDLALGSHDGAREGVTENSIRRLDSNRAPLRVVRAIESELLSHNKKLSKINEDSSGKCLWLKTTDT